MLNQVIIMGRVTRDPELRQTGSGLTVASFSLACDRDYKDQQGNRETDFINCVAWRGTAEYAAKYFPKGRMAIVAGRLQVRSYTDKEGSKRTAWEVIVGSIYPGDYSRPAVMQTGANLGTWEDLQNGEGLDAPNSLDDGCPF